MWLGLKQLIADPGVYDLINNFSIIACGARCARSCPTAYLLTGAQHILRAGIVRDDWELIHQIIVSLHSYTYLFFLLVCYCQCLELPWQISLIPRISIYSNSTVFVHLQTMNLYTMTTNIKISYCFAKFNLLFYNLLAQGYAQNILLVVGR